MAPAGRKPKPPGHAVTRHPRAYDWIDVPSIPFGDGPELPPRRCDGSRWPGWIRSNWDAWKTMPHARLWHPSDWSFAMDTIELASRAFDDGAKIGLLTELRYREKAMGTTWAARQDQRTRYTEPAAADARSARVTNIDLYRDL